MIESIKNGDPRQIAREATKLLVLSMHRNLFAPIFGWLCFLDPSVFFCIERLCLFSVNGIKQESVDNSDVKDDSVGISVGNEEKHTEEKIESRKSNSPIHMQKLQVEVFGLIGYLLDLQLWFSLS